MNKILITLSILLISFFSISCFALSADNYYKKIDIIIERDPSSIDKLSNSLNALKTKYKSSDELISFIDSLINHINSKKLNSSNDYEFIKVVDGDTITIKYEWKNTNIRMIWLDAPESSALRFWEAECFWKEASEKLSNYLSWASKVTLEFDESQWKLDKYNRLLAYVFYNWENINSKMIRSWYAFEYTYNKSYKYQDEFKKNQTSASADKVGLWDLNTCNWLRKIQETKIETSSEVENIIEKIKTEDKTSADKSTPSVTTPIYPTTNFSCSKKTCSLMTSCEEAYYQLNTCWFWALDRDKDWVPCESICN